jgi:hypothetical protein
MFRGGVGITMIEFVHDALDSEIRTISGYYSYNDENIFPMKEGASSTVQGSVA